MFSSKSHSQEKVWISAGFFISRNHWWKKLSMRVKYFGMPMKKLKRY